jgi:hypothetical protein
VSREKGDGICASMYQATLKKRLKQRWSKYQSDSRQMTLPRKNKSSVIYGIECKQGSQGTISEPRLPASPSEFVQPEVGGDRVAIEW